MHEGFGVRRAELLPARTTRGVCRVCWVCAVVGVSRAIGQEGEGRMGASWHYASAP